MPINNAPIGGGGGITEESDPTALKKASNLSDLTNANQAIVNLGVIKAINDPSYVDVPLNSSFGWNQSSSGGGYSSNVTNGLKIWGPAVSGFSQSTLYGSPFIHRGSNPLQVNWSKKFIMSFRCAINQGTISNVRMKIQLGTGGGMALGIQKWGNQAISLFAHDGTTERTFDSGFIPDLNTPFDCRIEADGLGNAQLYINNAPLASTSQAPVGTSANQVQLVAYSNATITSGQEMQFCVGNMRIKFYDTDILLP